MTTLTISNKGWVVIPAELRKSMVSSRALRWSLWITAVWTTNVIRWMICGNTRRPSRARKWSARISVRPARLDRL